MAETNDNFLKDLNAQMPPIQSLEQLKSQIDIPKEVYTKPGAINLPQGTTGVNPIPNVSDISNFISSIGDATDADSSDLRAKAQTFDAGLNGYQFERYYNHPLFDELGFSAVRDNEALYNENSHIGHEMIRALPQFGNQFLSAFADAATFGGTTDQEAAKEMERAMILGSSTKGGATGFTTNLVLNSAYTFGIIGELAAEEIALAGVTALSGLTASGATVPLMFARGVRAADKIGDAWNVAKNVKRTLENLKDIEKSRSYFNKAVNSAGKFINPLEATTDFIKGVDNVKELNNLAKVSKGFGAFYGDVRQLRYTWGEATLEGGLVQNDLQKDLYAQFLKENNGEPLTDEQIETIKKTAKDAGVTTTIQNIPAILYSNKIVLDGLFKRLSKYGLADDVLEFTGKTKKGKFVENKLLDKNPYEFIESNWKGRVKEFKNPKNYAKAALFYTKANLVEGLQETYQESISGANKEYYFDLATKGSAIEGNYLSYITDGLKKMTTTAEGGEVFLSGFLMGTLAGGGARLAGSVINENTWHKFANPEKFEDLKKKDDEDIAKKLNTLNEFSNNFDKHLKDDLHLLVDQYNISKGKENAAKKNDTKAYYDLKQSAFFKQIFSVLQKGALEPFIDQLESYKQLSKEDIQESWGYTQDEFLGAIDSAIVNARRIESRYKVVQQQMRNPFDPTKYDIDNEPTKALVELSNYKGWQKAQEDLLFMHETFDRQLTRITSLMNEIQADSNLTELPASDFSNLYDYDSLDTEIELLNLEIENAKGLTDPTIKKDLTYKKQKLNHLNNFKESVKNLETFFEVDENGDYLLNKEEGKKAYNKTKDVYRRYLRHLAKDKYYAFDEALDNSFEKLVDLYLNKADAKKINDTINRILNPSSFTKMAKRYSDMEGFHKQKQQERWKDSLQKYQKSKYVNQGILEKLYNTWKVFIDPEDLKALVENGVLPKTFYKVTEKLGNEIEELERNSETYREVIAHLRAVIKDLLNLPIVEQEVSPYNLKNRPKDKTDKRTFNDLAAQYKFSPTSLTSEVFVKELLTVLSTSNEASATETRLASLLLKTVDNSAKIIFTQGLSKPFVKDNEGYKIDARYSSEDYSDGVFPLEVIILKSEIARRIGDSVKTDTEFRGKLERMFNAATSHWESTRKEPLPLGLSFVKEDGDNVANLEEFALEAMTNSTFQVMLASVPFTGSTSANSVWQSFVDSVLTILKKLNITKSGDLLNEALAVITTKIDDISGIEPKQTAGTKPTTGSDVDKKFKLKTDPTTGVSIEGEDVTNHLENVLGWTIKQWKKLTPAQRVAVANENMTPEAYDEAEGAIIAEKSTKLLLDEAKKIVEDQINALLDVKSLDALKEAEDAVNSFLMTETKAIREDGRPFTYFDVLENTGIANVPAYLNIKINKAKNKLLTNFTIDDVKVGTRVKLQTGTVVEITELTDDGFIGQPLDPSKSAIPFDFESIKLIQTEAMKTYSLGDIAGVPDDAEVVSSADSDISDESIQNADEEITDDEIEKIINEDPTEKVDDLFNRC